MKVQATKDGIYGGHYRHGPYKDDHGNFHEGEVFEIDAKPYVMKDESGNPIQKIEPTGDIHPVTNEPIMKKVWEMENGKPKKDRNGHPVPVYRMATSFSKEWMQPVNDDATISYPEQSEPLGVLPNYRELPKTPEKITAARVGELPSDVKALIEEREKSPI